MGSTDNDSCASYGPKGSTPSRHTRSGLKTIRRMDAARKTKQDNAKVQRELDEIQRKPKEKTGDSNDGKTDGTHTQQSHDGRQGQEQQAETRSGQSQSRYSYITGTGGGTTQEGGGKDNQTNYGKGGSYSPWSYPPRLSPSTTKR